MPSIPPFEGPFRELNSRFRLQARRQVDSFRHGETPHAEQENQWVEALDQEARLKSMPPHYVFINTLLHRGYDIETVCERLGVTLVDVRAAQAWLRNEPPGGSVDVTV